MRVLVLGANGRTGSLVVDYALEQGYSVTALVRRTGSMAGREGLTVAEGTPLDIEAIDRAFSSAPADDPIRAVIVTLAASRASDSPWAKPVSPRFFIRDSVRNVTKAMRLHGVSRIVLMSAFGTGDSWSQLSLLVKLVFKSSNMMLQVEDHSATDLEVRSVQDLEWTFARPTMLKEQAPGAGIREFGEEGKGIGMFDGCSRESVATWMVDALRDPQTIRKAVCLAN